MAFVIVQHVSAQQQSMLATLLARATSMPVTEVQDGTRIAPNTVEVVTPNRSLVIDDGRHLDDVPDGRRRWRSTRYRALT